MGMRHVETRLDPADNRRKVVEEGSKAIEVDVCLSWTSKRAAYLDPVGVSYRRRPHHDQMVFKFLYYVAGSCSECCR